MGILEILASKDIIRPADVASIKEEARLSGESIERLLLKRGVSSEAITDAKSDHLGVPTRDLGDSAVPFSILKLIPEESALHYKFAPIGIKDGVLEVGLVDPDNIDARDALTFISSKANLPFKIFLISEDDFRKIIEMYKGLSGEVTKALTELDSELSGDGLEEELSQPADTSGKPSETKIIEDAPVTKIVATILRYATEGSASDIHIEPMADRVRVRFRVDGVLNTSLVLPIKVHNAIVARIKILCQTMKLDEKRKPQDGSFSTTRIGGRKIDFRVSTFPTYYGEKVVMRILDQQKGVKKLDEMGMTPRNLELLKKALKRPFGIILISGPTGSGKTTTLYSMLNEINREEKNVLSLEDPIEYNVEGVSQSQIRPEIGYTFANGLRTTLRQDPDVILVGEIRDKETAQLAIQAALTGHLVLSTIHTNSAVGIIQRLVDMEVDPYLIPPTLALGMAQRLVSMLCPNTGKPVPVDGSIKMMIDKEFSTLPAEFRKDVPMADKVYEIEPTAECPNGTRGRAAIFEAFEMDREIERIILTNPIESEILKAVRAKGMLTMREDAILKAFKREIPFSEANKV
jgi:type IV pilus assembly protein PilB